MSGLVRAVFWDLGGVILRTRDQAPRRAWEDRLGLAHGELARIVFDGPASQRALLGQATADEVWRSVGDTLGLAPADRERLRSDFFSTDEVDQELMAFIRRLRSRVRVGLISNAWSEVRGLAETRWSIADAFDPLLLSAEAGLVKPDTRIYLLALQRARLAPAQAVFVDDFVENVEAAESLGIQPVLFRSTLQATAEVKAWVDQA